MTGRRTGSDSVWTLFEGRAQQSSDGGLTFLDGDGVPSGTGWDVVADRAAHVAGHLAAVGVARGNRVALLGRNSLAQVAALGAIARLGAIAVPLNHALTASELAFQLSDTTPTVVIGDPTLTDTVDVALREASHQAVRLTTAPSESGWQELSTSVAPPPVVAVDPMDPFEIVYTSGTADRPKGVLLSHRSLVEEAHRNAAAVALRPDDTIFGHAPVFHVSGQNSMLFPSMLIRSTVAFGVAFSASRWSRDLLTADATVAFVVGPQIRMIMAQPPNPADHANRLRIALCGLAVPEAMEREFTVRFGTPVYALSGSTECLGASYIEPAFVEHRWPSLGRPAADREVMIQDDAGREVAVGEPGELCVRGERGVALMLGYWNRPDAEEAAFRDGWYHTGDIGRSDEDGYLFFVDRKKDVIKRSGENISASEVERALLECGGIADAAVVGRPDDIRDESVVAFIVLEHPEVDLAQIRSGLETRLAAYKIPEELIVIDEFPLTSLGKVEKKTLRRWAADRTGTA